MKNIPSRTLLSIGTSLFSAAAMVRLDEGDAFTWLVVLGALAIALGLIWSNRLV